MMASNVPLPDPLDLSDKDHASENWQLFKTQWLNYVTLTEAFKPKQTSLSNKVKIALFYSVIGGQAVKLIQKICEPEATVDTIISRLNNYFLESKNITYERFLFNSAIQKSDETCKEYINRLHELARGCKFGDLAELSKLQIEEHLICDRLVAGILDNNLKKRLLAKKKLSLSEASDLCITEEQANNLASKISENSETARNSFDETAYATKFLNLKKCKFCGVEHKRGANNCPAFGKFCSNCKKKNHFSKVCMQKKQAINELSEKSGENSEEENEIFEIKNCFRKKRLFVNLLIPFKNERKVLKCQLDSGATCNVIGLDELRRLTGSENPRLEPSQTVLTFYGGDSQVSLGKIKFHAIWKKQKYKMIFEIISTPHNPLIGAQDCLRLGLIVLDSGVFQLQNSKSPATILEDFPDIGKGLGCFEGIYNFKLDKSIAPVVVPPRRYPLALREEICKEIQRLENLGVIKKMSDPSEWVSAMVVVKKPNKLRICIDPHQLNKAIQRSHYQSPTVEELAPQLTNAKFFSVLDLKDGFWHIKLSEEASKLTTFWTPLGRYRWLRMPFGVRSAPEEFQRRVHEAIEGLEGVAGIADDILIWGCGKTEREALENHNDHLLAFLNRATAKQLKINMSKCKIGLTEVKYMGHIISKDGLKPDPEKVSSLKNIERPKNKEEARRFLGFVNYLGKFVPHLADLAAPIRTLLKEDSQWTWQKLHDDAYKKLVDAITSAPTLKYFDQNKQAVIQADASQFGLGASLMQEGKPVAYISRTLSKAESAYAQIEKECLAVLFAFERFEQYLFGKKDVVVESDHKPLETIFKKSLNSAPKRLQRMLLRLQKFSFKVVYKPGRTMHVADFLSRAPVSNDLHQDNNEVLIFEASKQNLAKDLEQNNSFLFLNISDERLTVIRRESGTDAEIRKLRDVIQQGWPEKKSNLPEDIKKYWNFRDELGIEDGVVLKGEKIVVPKAMRAELLNKIHSSHQGTEACLRRAKDVFYWFGMSTDIKEMVKGCKVCKKYAPAQQKQPLRLQETPARPWQKIAVDFAQEGKNHYIIMSDYYSSFFEVKKTKSCSADTLIEFCKEQFARYGIPETVVGDHGTPLVSQKFKEFSRQWMFSTIFSSPYHHQANGKAESAVKIFKSLLKKVRDSKSDFLKALLEWRNTPLKDIGYSPSQLLMSRRTKSLVPIKPDLLKPQVPQDVVQKWDARKDSYKAVFDRGAKELPSLSVGQKVWVQKSPQVNSEPWTEGKVVQREGERRYTVEVDGRRYLRNRRFIRT